MPTCSTPISTPSRLALDAKCAQTVPKRRAVPHGRTPEMCLTCATGSENLAVAEGFEPSDGGYPSHAFEACSLGRSDTPPSEQLTATRQARVYSQSLAGEELLQRRGALVGQHAAPHLRADGSAGGRAPRPTASRPRRSSAPTPRTPPGRPAPSPARPRTSCTARPSPPASRLPAATRRRARAAAARMRQDLGVRGRIAQRLTGVGRAGQLGAVGARRPPHRSARRAGPPPRRPRARRGSGLRRSVAITDRVGRAPPTARRRSPSPARSGPSCSSA